MRVTLLLPHFGTIDERLDEVTAEKLHEVWDLLETTELRVYIPRFKVDSSAHSLANDLVNVGVQDMGQPDKGSMDELHNGMCIHDVVHRSVLEVDEEGAADPVAPKTFEISCAAKCPDVRFDRCFLAVVHMDSCVMQLAKVGSLSDPRLYPSQA